MGPAIKKVRLDLAGQLQALHLSDRECVQVCLLGDRLRVSLMGVCWTIIEEVFEPLFEIAGPQAGLLVQHVPDQTVARRFTLPSASNYS